MDTIELIGLFKEWSGRLDMTDDTVLLYINSGQRLLDDLTDHTKTKGRYIYPGTVGLYNLSLLAQARMIEKIDLVIDKTSEKVIEVTIDTLKAISETLPSFREAALPKYFSMAPARKVSTQNLRAVDTGKFGLTEIGRDSVKLDILFECPLDKDYTIDITGKFYSEDISLDRCADSFWLMHYPFTLVHAALYRLETSYRNREGAADWMASIREDLRLVDLNLAEQESNGINQMEG